MYDITIRAKVYPTEDAEKVKRAVLAIFPDADAELHEGVLTASARSLERFKEILRDSRIRDAARARILDGKQGEKTEFLINKQAAFVGKVNFVAHDQEPLGAIEVSISAPELDILVDEVAPSTRGPSEGSG